jgi:ribonucleoside-triphosphate reductase (thioredoxin)
MQLTESFLEKYKNRSPEWGYEGLGWVVFQRTYSRPLPGGGMEKWWQTVRRVVEGSYEIQKDHCDRNGLPWNAYKSQRSAQRMYDLIFNFKILPPGRGLWAMGTNYVRQRGSAALNNCAFISTENIKSDFSYPFCFLMDMSMLGVGVGADTRGAGSIVFQEPANGGVHEVIDSREGWVEATKQLLEAYAYGYPLPIFDYSKVRPAGAPISGFGGISSGPVPLESMHKAVNALLRSQIGNACSSAVIVDIFNYIGRAVAAGGIRRSAEIMLGSPDDEEFITLKDPTLHPEELKSHRWTSNNSLTIDRPVRYEKYVDQIMTNGEPGFFWLDNARHYRRMKDGRGDYDTFIMGQNPCGEISLESGEFCNLVELYPAAFDTVTEFLASIRYAYLYAKSVSLLPTHNLQTNAIIGRNRRLGVSISGVVQAIAKFGYREFFDALDQGYKLLREIDREYSKWLCVPESIKLTTIKPSGTISLLAGATPGIHHSHSPYYLRNVRFHPESPLLPILKDAGYPLETSVYDDNTVVVGFPIKEKYFTKGKADVTMWEQLELAAQMQHYWADNSVSVTVTVKPEEKKDLAAALHLYETRLKSVSLLPASDHGYEQAPYIEITEDEYNAMKAKIKPIEAGFVAEAHDVDETGCTNDSCSII